MGRVLTFTTTPHHSRATWLAVTLMAVVVSFSSALLLNGRNLVQDFLQRESEDVRWVVFAKDGADLATMEKSLRELPGLRDLRLVSKEEALERARQDVALAGGLALLGRNPFPASFEVQWSRDFLRSDALEWSARRVGAWSEVDGVGYDRSRIERLTLLQRLASQWDLALGVFVWGTAGALLLLIGRWLFFSTAPVPWRPLTWGLLSGALGGLAGAAASYALMPPFFVLALPLGAVVGLFAVAWATTHGEH